MGWPQAVSDTLRNRAPQWVCFVRHRESATVPFEDATESIAERIGNMEIQFTAWCDQALRGLEHFHLSLTKEVPMRRAHRRVLTALGALAIALAAFGAPPPAVASAGCQYVFCANGCYSGGCHEPCEEVCYGCPYPGWSNATGCDYPE